MTTPDKERDQWDVLAADPVNVGGGPGSPSVEHMFAMIDPAPAEHILDLGSGPGRIAVPVADLFDKSKVWCVDVSAVMLTLMPDRPNITKVLGDGRTVPDVVPPVGFGWSVLMFQHIPPWGFATYMRAVADHLASGGVFVCQWVTHAEDHDYSHPVAQSLGVAFGIAAGLQLDATWTDPVVDEWAWARWTKR